MPAPEDRLESLSREELLELVRRMLRRDPDVERLLPSGGARGVGARDRKPEDVETATRRAVRDAFRHAGFVHWRNEGGVLADLEDVHAEAAVYADAGRSAEALEVLVAASSEVLAHFDQIDDSNGVISGEVRSWLEEAPVHVPPDLAGDRRVHLVDLLLGIADADYGSGADAGPVLAVLAAPEPFLSERVERWAADDRAATRKRWDFDSTEAILILLNLYAEQERWKEYLDLAAEGGQWGRYAYVGLQHGLDPLDIASRVGAQARPPDALEVAKLLFEAGLTDASERVFAAVLDEVPSSEEALRGIAEVALSRGELDEAERLLLQAVGAGRGSVAYARLREAFGDSSGWEATRDKAHAALRAADDKVTLVRALLDEDEPALAAREALELDPSWAYRTMRAAAEAVEGEEPALAVELYRLLAESCIARTQRQMYRIAAGYLARVRSLLVGSGDEAAWSALIGDLRREYRRRPALLEELDRRGVSATAGSASDTSKP